MCFLFLELGASPSGGSFFSFSPASWTANAMLVLQSGLLALGVTFPALFPGESDAGVPCLHTLG